MDLVEFGSVMQMQKGKKPSSQSNTAKEGYLPYVDIKAFEAGDIDNYTNDEKCVSCDDGDILIVCDGSRSGLVGKAVRGYVGSTLAKISAEGMTPDYLYYFLQGKYELLNTRKKGTGTPHLNADILKKQKLIIPAEEIQNQIVFRIEELFSELDKGIETLQKTQKELTLYRQAVLIKAFEGQYTVEWRDMNRDASGSKDFAKIEKKNVLFKDTSGDENEMELHLPLSWTKVRLGEVFDVEVGGTPKRSIPEYWDGNVNWVSSGEVHFSQIYSTNETITHLGLEHTSTNVHPAGTVMLAMIGEGKTRGQAAILEIPAAHNQNTAAILVSETPCSPWFVYYYLVMNYEHTRRVGSGNNQKALNKERVKALRIPFPPFSEQEAIVQEIESRLTVCESIERSIASSLRQSLSLRQSILKKAFEGEL